MPEGKVVTPEKKETKGITPFQSFIISSINPKFTNFNRPLLLSLLVGGATFIGVISIFAVEASRKTCLTTYPQYFGTVWNTKSFVSSVRSADANVAVTICLNRVGALAEPARGKGDNIGFRINGAIQAVSANGNGVVGLEPCYPTKSFMRMDFTEVRGCFAQTKDEEPSCGNCISTLGVLDDGTTGYSLSATGKNGPMACSDYWTTQRIDGGSCLNKQCATPDGSAEAIEWCSGEDEAFANTAYDRVQDMCHSTNYFGNEIPLLTDWTVQTCTSTNPATAFGIASGYSSYLELIVTAVIIASLTSGGVLKTTMRFRKAFGEALSASMDDDPMTAVNMKVKELEEKLEALAARKSEEKLVA